MTPSIGSFVAESSAGIEACDPSPEPQRKRRRTLNSSTTNNDSSEATSIKQSVEQRPSPLSGKIDSDGEAFVSTLPLHPHGIRPLGNLYSAAQPNIKLHAGSLAPLPDELLVHVLEQLDAPDLLRIGGTCKALSAFGRHDELWKTLLVESPLATLKAGQHLDWQGSWRATYLSLPPDRQARLNCTGLYSDTLFRPFHCANVPMEPFADPSRFRSCIPKLADLSPEAFRAEWADRPFILTEPVKRWNVYREWDLEKLRSQYESKIFRCEAVDWPMETYAQYMRQTTDESPLYLFDSRFVEKMDLCVGTDAISEATADYTPPFAFSPDLFTVLGDERPSHRWLIMGPQRSGSSFHTDPNGTSAWNAVLKGRKYWIMSPTPPPGVYVSEDESEVTSPSSIGEWLLEFHEEARKMPDVCEGICEEGEVLHVPGGWYHLVVNIPPNDGGPGDNIAITQNFVPEPRLQTVLKFLRDKPDQVSGFQFSDDNQDERADGDGEAFNAYELFVSRLQEQYPDIATRALAELRCPEKTASKQQQGVWEAVVKEKEERGGGFSFGFGGDDEGEVP